jgi:hypothetical protein
MKQKRKDPIVAQRNDGKVYLPKEKENKEPSELSNSGLGNIRCGHCQKIKSFEEVRWSSLQKKTFVL